MGVTLSCVDLVIVFTIITHCRCFQHPGRLSLSYVSFCRGWTGFGLCSAMNGALLCAKDFRVLPFPRAFVSLEFSADSGFDCLSLSEL